jgi:hypothetical protein
VVELSRETKLIRVGTLAVEVAKLRANASKHRAMSCGLMKKEEQRLNR